MRYLSFPLVFKATHSFFTTLESGEFRATAIPNADIAAFWHNSRNGYFIHVFRTSYEKVGLLTCVYNIPTDIRFC
jgi:hypothetical protein